MGATEILKTRVTPETKVRVLSLAQEQLLTEAAWLRHLVARALRETSGSSASSPEASARLCDRVVARRERSAKDWGRASRLYARLRREDQLLLIERAAARGMAAATYGSVLLRSHLRALAPLPRDELAALRHAVSELGAIGRNLNQITRAMNQGARVAGAGRGEFEAILKICEALRDHTKDLIKSNAASWACGYVEISP
jgi:hypothetical protein